METDDFTQRFVLMEDELSLFDIEIDGIPIWERIRYKVYYSLERDGSETNAIDTDTRPFLKISDKYREVIQGVSLWGKNLFVKNPYVASDCDYLFWGHQRRKQHNELWWDIYCDPIYDALNINSLHLEVAHKGENISHLSPAKTSDIRYIDFPVFTGTILRELFHKIYHINSTDIAQIERIEREIEARFDRSIDIKQIIKKKMLERKGRKKLYEILLRRHNPKIVFLVVSVFRDTFIESCKKFGTPVVELQHGGFGPDHPGYSFPGNRTKKTFPDYLFTFGEFWKDRMEFPIPKKNIYPVGYPYLSWQKEQYQDVSAKNSILFISQGPYGETITRFAADYAQLEEKYDVIVKLHPDESNNWKSEYPWLSDAPLTVIDGNEPPLYKLLSECTVQVGVNSTALYEGLLFSKRTYLFEQFSPMRTDHLVEQGQAQFVNTPKGLHSSLRKEWDTPQKDINYYFSKNPISNIKSAINDIHRRESI